MRRTARVVLRGVREQRDRLPLLLSRTKGAGHGAGFLCWCRLRPAARRVFSLSEDVLSVKGFWYNKVTRILLVVTLSNIGASFGTFIGGADIVRRLFENLG